MNAFVSAILGIAFGLLGTATVFLMFHLWGYPFDKVTRTSAAPKWLMRLHRVLGFLFLGLYLLMMSQMVPRLLRYQVEFPPRTVAHIILGITIGFLLLVKISILRFFRHLEEWMPFLGTGILLCTYLLLGLSVPFALRERQLRANALGGNVLSRESLERVKRLLPHADFPKEAPLDELAKESNIAAGRSVLLTQCVQCHDLKTVLTRPRTPKDWVRTVERMADKPSFAAAMTDTQQWAVATYLIAISPELQQSSRKARQQMDEANQAIASATTAIEAPQGNEPFRLSDVKPLFETKCSDCHALDEVTKHKWKNTAEAKAVLRRMAENGLEATQSEFELLNRYLIEVYVKPTDR